MDVKIQSIYSEKKSTYWGQYGGDVLKTIIPIVVIFGGMMYTSYQSFLKHARANWGANQCNPVYMPFAGVIMPQPGQPAFKTTSQNFNFCIQRDLSAVFSVALLPLEFVNFLILATLDLIIQGMVQIMKLYAYLANLFKVAGVDINKRLMTFIIPLTITVAKMRDLIAKASALMLTAVYSTFTIYNIMVSGLLNILSIILGILIVLSATIAALYAAGAILTAFVITAPVGLPLIIIATGLLLIAFIPTLIIYIILAIFMTDTFGSKVKAHPF